MGKEKSGRPGSSAHFFPDKRGIQKSLDLENRAITLPNRSIREVDLSTDLTTEDYNLTDLLKLLVVELRKIELHMAIRTGEDIKDKDVW